MRGALAALAMCGCAVSVKVARSPGQVAPTSVALVEFVAKQNTTRRADIEIPVTMGCLAAANALGIRAVDLWYAGKAVARRAETLVRGGLMMLDSRRGTGSGILELELVSASDGASMARASVTFDAADPELAGRTACRALLDPGFK